MGTRALVLLVGAGLAIAGVAQAHHSIAGVYDTSRQATVDGVITEFRFVNPHPSMDVKDSRTWDPLESTCRHASLSIL